MGPGMVIEETAAVCQTGFFGFGLRGTGFDFRQAPLDYVYYRKTGGQPGITPSRKAQSTGLQFNFQIGLVAAGAIRAGRVFFFF